MATATRQPASAVACAHRRARQRFRWRSACAPPFPRPYDRPAPHPGGMTLAVGIADAPAGTWRWPDEHAGVSDAIARGLGFHQFGEQGELIAAGGVPHGDTGFGRPMAMVLTQSWISRSSAFIIISIASIRLSFDASRSSTATRSRRSSSVIIMMFCISASC